MIGEHTMQPLNELRIPQHTGQDLPHPLRRPVDGETPLDGFVDGPLVGQPGQSVGVEDLDNLREQAVLSRSPAIPIKGTYV